MCFSISENESLIGCVLSLPLCDSLIGCMWNLPIQKVEIPARLVSCLRYRSGSNKTDIHTHLRAFGATSALLSPLATLGASCLIARIIIIKIIKTLEAARLGSAPALRLSLVIKEDIMEGKSKDRK